MRTAAALRRSFLVATMSLLLPACAGTQSLHPPPPPVGDTPPLPDPPPSRVVLHATILAEALKAQLDAHLPKEGGGEIPVVGKEAVPYKWTREPVAVQFDGGRVHVT